MRGKGGGGGGGYPFPRSGIGTFIIVVSVFKDQLAIAIGN